MRSKLKVIEGFKDKPVKKEYKFIKAMATDTRLMGVVGIVIHWADYNKNDLYQLFHLDFEEFGIDNFKEVTDEEALQVERSKMMGGLGGQFVDINFKEVSSLINEAIDRNPFGSDDWINDIENFHMYEECNDLTYCDKCELMNKICVQISNNYELINYYIMRIVGLDEEGYKYLSDVDKDIRIVQRPSILLKNTVEKIDENKYIVESLVDLNQRYEIILSQIEILNNKIVNHKINGQMKISPREAAFSLRKKEYIMIYLLDDKSDFLQKIESDKPHAMINDYEGGTLITEFNSNNNHVKEKTYYLSEDIRGIYYITDANQLIIGTYNTKKATVIGAEINKKYNEFLTPFKNVKLENGIIYDFVQSGQTNILDFLY